MKKLYNILLLLLFLFPACEEKEQEPYVWPVQPATLLLPESSRAEVEKIASGSNSTVIQKRMVELIDATPKDATIHIAIYSFNSLPEFLFALKRADSRNIQMKIMVDMSDHDQQTINDNLPYVNEIKRMGDNVDVVLVDNDAGAIAIMHNKFILISRIITEEGEKENIVFQSSMNFSSAGGKKINDAVTFSHEGLYNAYSTYWQDVAELAGGGMKEKYDYREYQDPQAGITAFFYPRRTDGVIGDDNIIGILNDITDPSSATVKVGMSGWSSSRISLLYKLEELLDMGANIQIITKSSISGTVQEELRRLAGKGAYVNIYDMSRGSNIHSKFMLIEGEWRGEKTNLVLTGSQNFTNNAYKYNNEVSLLLRDHEFFPTYVSYYEELKSLPGICCF